MPNVAQMNLQERLDGLARLGDWIRNRSDERLEAVIHRAQFHNPWFTTENQRRALDAIADHLLDRDKLAAWAARYAVPERPAPLTVAMVMAGNIPLVGFHDLICTFAAGCKASVRLSDKDAYLLPFLLQQLEHLAPGSAGFFETIPVLQHFDAVIATGSNNSSRYFEAYFGKYPHVIRRNRNAVAVLDGQESADQLHALGKDVFRYFGLGCRNVSKIYVPQGYDFQLLLEKLHDYRELVLHPKYLNNFEYNLALVLLNQVPHFNNGCVVLTENEAIASRIAMLHFSFYHSREQLAGELGAHGDEIQCIVARQPLQDLHTIPFGSTQEPGLLDYPDGVDVMAFLLSLLSPSD
ncbi:MAG: hypothetical protein RLY31_2449 [Bacteroidota bacterium]|jgi:hypothetical protein